MHFLDINQIILEKEKENILRTERQRQLDEPFTRYFFLIDEILYPDFSFGHSLIGSPQSIRNITLNDVLSFYHRYYVPNNAILCLSGDLNTQKAKELITKYFESIPKGLEPIVYPQPEFPLGPSGRDQIMIDPLVSSPAMQFAVRIENYQSEDVLIFRMMEQILFNGNSSRLVSRLIRKERLALYLSGGFEERREFQALKIFLLANNQYMIDRSKKILIDELHRLKTEMVSEKEMTKAKNNIKYNYVKEMTGSNLSRALGLAERYLKERNLPVIGSELTQLERITSYSILSLARKHLKEENYCFITILPR
jgi:predicted Zn-dependent peptidase